MLSDPHPALPSFLYWRMRGEFHWQELRKEVIMDEEDQSDLYLHWRRTESV